jgi:hypothetical protein
MTHATYCKTPGIDGWSRQRRRVKRRHSYVSTLQPAAQQHDLLLPASLKASRRLASGWVSRAELAVAVIARGLDSHEEDASKCARKCSRSARAAGALVGRIHWSEVYLPGLWCDRNAGTGFGRCEGWVEYRLPQIRGRAHKRRLHILYRRRGEEVENGDRLLVSRPYYMSAFILAREARRRNGNRHCAG